MNLQRSSALAAACIGTLGTYYLLRGVMAQDLFYSFVGVASAAAIVTGTRLWRPVNASSWYLFAGGQFLFACGDSAFDFYDVVFHRPAPVPSVADAIYLAGYAMLFVGLLRLAPRSRPGAVPRIDSAIIVATVVLACWMFLIEPGREAGGGFWPGLTAAAYPTMDALIIAMLLRLMVSHRLITPAYRGLIAAAALLFVTDAIYNPQLVNGTYVTHSWLDAGWLLSYVIWGAAALHPSMVEAPAARALNPRPLSPLRIAIVFGAVAATPAAIALQQLAYGRVQVWSTAVAGVLLAAFAAVRIAVLARSEVGLRARIERSERYFRSLIENASDLIVIIGADGVIRYGSPSCERILGRTAASLVGAEVGEIIHPDDLHVVTEPQRDGPFEARVQHPDGSWRTLEGDATRAFDDPDIDGVLINARDITDRRLLEEEFRHSQKLEAIGQLAGGVAHDFNNLLTAIFGYTEIAAARVEHDPLQARADLAQVSDAARRAADLTRQLLIFSRRQTLELTVLELGDVVARAQGLLARLIGSQIEFVVEASAGGARHVVADDGQLGQVLVNLVVNARDAMPNGGVLTVSLAERQLDESAASALGLEAAGGYATLTVADTGIGMSQATRERIFEPFFTTKPVGEGTGLGLSTVYGIVKQTRGTISVASTVGEGTAFTIYLPVAEAQDLSAAEPAPVASPGRGETILLVEDERVVRELTAELLELRGYTVVRTGFPSQALDLCSAGAPFDLLLTDLAMPEMTGLELSEAVRDTRPGMPVLLTSGYADQASEHETGEAFLQKPFDGDSLALKVRALLDGVPAAP